MDNKWYFKTHVVVIAFFCVGPLALPLVWFNPGLSRKTKTIISVIILAVSYLLGIVFVNSLKTIYEYYNLLYNLL